MANQSEPVGPQDDSPFTPPLEIYIAAMWNLKLPDHTSVFKLGWDMTAQLMRKIEEPHDWCLNFRYRHYRTRDGIFDGRDLRRWNQWRLNNLDETAAVEAVGNSLKCLADEFPGKIEIGFLPVHGDIEELIAAVDRLKPEWLHFQRAHDE